MSHSCTVEIWSFSLLSNDAQLIEFERIISPAEKQRAYRLHAFNHQRRAIISAAKLRIILSQYLHIKPEHINYLHNEFGKPYIENNPVHFNLSHSFDHAMIAISKDAPVGIDIEHHREKLDIQGLVRKVFTVNEQAQFAKLGPEEQVYSFYKVWTCKEAILKALGTGLHLPFSTIEVEINQNNSSKIIALNCISNKLDEISLVKINAPANFIAHIAAISPSVKLLYR